MSWCDALNPAMTAATQWFERTLDDSANKRLSVPEAFLAVDGILNLYINVADGLVVYPKVIEQRLHQGAALYGHREHHDGRCRSGAATVRSSTSGSGCIPWRLPGWSRRRAGKTICLHRIAADPIFGVTLEELHDIVKPEKYVGRAPQQTEDFLEEVVAPVFWKSTKMWQRKQAEITV